MDGNFCDQSAAEDRNLMLALASPEYSPRTTAMKLSSPPMANSSPSGEKTMCLTTFLLSVSPFVTKR